MPKSSYCFWCDGSLTHTHKSHRQRTRPQGIAAQPTARPQPSLILQTALGHSRRQLGTRADSRVHTRARRHVAQVQARPAAPTPFLHSHVPAPKHGHERSGVTVPGRHHRLRAQGAWLGLRVRLCLACVSLRLACTRSSANTRASRGRELLQEPLLREVFLDVCTAANSKSQNNQSSSHSCAYHLTAHTAKHHSTSHPHTQACTPAPYLSSIPFSSRAMFPHCAATYPDICTTSSSTVEFTTPWASARRRSGTVDSGKNARCAFQRTCSALICCSNTGRLGDRLILPAAMSMRSPRSIMRVALKTACCNSMTHTHTHTHTHTYTHTHTHTKREQDSVTPVSHHSPPGATNHTGPQPRPAHQTGASKVCQCIRLAQ